MRVAGPVRAGSPPPAPRAWIAGQALINIGAVLGLLPIAGLPLPLVSYGGSALLPTLVALGMLVAFARDEPGARAALAARGPGPVRRAVARVRRAAPASMDAQPLRVVLAGGGTAGHIEPALALADALRRRDPDTEVTVLGTERGLETRLVPERGYPLELDRRRCRCRAAPPSDLLTLPSRLRAARRGADRVLARTARRRGGRLRRLRRRRRPTWPPGAGTCRSSCTRRTSDPGWPTGSVRARPHGSRSLSAGRGCRTPGTSGMPLRRSITTLDRAGAARVRARPRFGLDADRPTLLVFGGSQGARRLNDAVAGAARRPGRRRRPGAAHRRTEARARRRRSVDAAGGRPGPAAPPYVRLDYFDRMDLAYAAADLALCRAGA